jgi:hypothetical protein
VCDCTPTATQFLVQARNSNAKEGLFNPSKEVQKGDSLGDLLKHTDMELNQVLLGEWLVYSMQWKDLF